MIKGLAVNLLLLLILSGLLAVPFLPFNYLALHSSSSVLSAKSWNDNGLVAVSDLSPLSKKVSVKVFPGQAAYYDDISSLANLTSSPKTYSIAAYYNLSNAKVKVGFSNNLSEIHLNPGEKTSINLEVFGILDVPSEELIILEIN